MKLTTKVRYATRAMVDVAIHGNDVAVPMKDIAARQGIPEPYLRQLVLSLRTAGLIRVMRGAHGGLRLIRPADEIKISEIAIAMEGAVSLVECVDNPEYCSRSEGCPTRELWAEMADSIMATLASRTLWDLAQCAAAGSPDASMIC